jgi:hypothetical protein
MAVAVGATVGVLVGGGVVAVGTTVGVLLGGGVVAVAAGVAVLARVGVGLVATVGPPQLVNMIIRVSRLTCQQEARRSIMFPPLSFIISVSLMVRRGTTHTATLVTTHARLSRFVACVHA